MNYRHAYHAGNFADCMKHAVLVWLIDALQRKPAPLFVLDTHAGAGSYDLESAAARRTGEARKGIDRVLAAGEPALRRYLEVVRALNRGGTHYPGSPLLIRHLLRADDRLACCELHPEDAYELQALLRGDPRVAVHHRDGWEALRALLPPKERRGLILIDPPFEDPEEFVQAAIGLVHGYERFRTGVFACWYPIKHRAPVRGFFTALQRTGMRDIVAAELCLREPLDAGRLNGCGMLVVNPPYQFETEAPPLLEALLAVFGGREPGAFTSVARVVDE